MATIVEKPAWLTVKETAMMIIPNDPAALVAQALNNAKRAIEEANKQ